MKKFFNYLIFLSILVVCTDIQAVRPYDCYNNYFLVKLFNLGQDDCTLVKKALITGDYNFGAPPVCLPADGSKHEFIMSGSLESHLILTYKCGANKKITLNMRHYVKKNHWHTSIDASSSDAQDVFEKHDSKVAVSGDCSPGIVSWILYN